MPFAPEPSNSDLRPDETALYAREVAKNLILRTIATFADEPDSHLETEATQEIQIEEPINIDTIDDPSPARHPSIINRYNCLAVNEEIAIKYAPGPGSQEILGSESSIDEKDVIEEEIEGEEEVQQAENMGGHDWVPKIDETVSLMFKRADNQSESSIIPLGILGDNPEVIFQKYSKQGYLAKKSSNMFLGWQRRYFEVRGFKLYYSKTAETLRDKKEVRCINLFVNPCRIQEAKGQTMQIAIDGVKNKMNLKASSLVEAKEWVDFFTDLFTFVDKNAYKATKYITRKREKLLKIDVITEEEFLTTVETGDLLLFKSLNAAARLQRTFTSSRYDHVGLLVRAFDDIYLYDSVYQGGVQLTNWKDFKAMEYHKDYERIAYRKLEIKDQALRNAIKEDLFKFVTAHTGRKYELNLTKLLRRNSNTYGSNQNNANETRKTEPLRNEAGFFCSELVAAAYKHIDLLNPNIASSRYFPVSFSQKKGLKLLRGAALSNEYALALTDDKAKKKVY